MTALNIAIVDDDVDILDSASQVFAQQGWHAALFEHPAKLVGTLRSGSSYDCVLLDPHLAHVKTESIPGLVSYLKNFAPVLILTAQPDSSVAKRALAAGAASIIVKPASAAWLINSIAELTNPAQ